jgi:hypothetical protein
MGKGLPFGESAGAAVHRIRKLSSGYELNLDHFPIVADLMAEKT